MRVLLINPPYSREERYGKDLGRFGPLNEPLGLAYVAASLERAGHDVSILDAPALGIPSEDIPRQMEGRDCSIAGVAMLTPMYSRSMEVVRTLREAFPKLRIVVGGAHPTILPRETMELNPEIDFAVMGEGEGIMAELAGALERGKGFAQIRGLAYRSGHEVRVNPPALPIPDLDNLPMPARHLLPMHAYRMTRSRTRSSHAYTVSVARGCPFDCAFCCRIFGRKVRHHSVARILEEIRILHERYGAREINLEADTLTVNKAFVHSLCRALLDSGLSREISWTCESRIDTVSEEMLREMKRAGCWQISYGVETGSQRLLDLIQKGTTLPRIEEVFTLTKRVGITIRAFYMLGLPTETREESLKTIAFARKLDARWSQFTLFTPFPGTDLYDLVVREGGLQSHNWEDFKTHGGWTSGGIAYVPKGRPLEEMKALQKRAYRAVYLRPKVFVRLVKEVDSLRKLREYGMGLWVLVKTSFPRVPGEGNRVLKVPSEELRTFAQSVYVDSPVYFARNPIVRAINWGKLDAILALFPSEERGRVLDLACGNGVMLPTLSGRFGRVVGVDFHVSAAERLRRARGLQNVSILRSDANHLPFKERSFPFILALSALEHFRALDALVREIHRIMAPGGYFLFLCPTESFFYRLGRKVLGYRKPEDHYHSAHEVLAILEKRLTLEEEGRFPSWAPKFLSIYSMGRFRKR